MAGGVAVARQIGSAALLDEVRTAFVHGMDTMLWVCGGVALASAILALLFLPRRPDGITGAPRGDAAGATAIAVGGHDAEQAELEV